MAWSAKSIFCGDDFVGFVYRSFGGTLTPADCGKMQVQAASRAVNTPGSPYITSMSTQEILAMADSDGFVSTGPDRGSHQCAALVKAAIPALGATSNWKKGSDLDSTNISDLLPGTAIGYGFDSAGDYPSHTTGNHVAIVSAVQGSSVSILDQWDSRPRSDRYQKAEIHLANLSTRQWSILTRKASETS